MNPENIPLIIALSGGIVIGSVAGFLAAGFFTAARVRRATRESWKQAELFWRKVKQEEAQ